jgi:hypothetical protein
MNKVDAMCKLMRWVVVFGWFSSAHALTPLRLMPLETTPLRSGFNQSLTLIWNERISVCQLQTVETTVRRLGRARSALEVLHTAEGKQ